MATVVSPSTKVSRGQELAPRSPLNPLGDLQGSSFGPQLLIMRKSGMITEGELNTSASPETSPAQETAGPLKAPVSAEMQSYVDARLGAERAEKTSAQSTPRTPSTLSLPTTEIHANNLHLTVRSDGRVDGTMALQRGVLSARRFHIPGLLSDTRVQRIGGDSQELHAALLVRDGSQPSPEQLKKFTELLSKGLKGSTALDTLENAAHAVDCHLRLSGLNLTHAMLSSPLGVLHGAGSIIADSRFEQLRGRKADLRGLVTEGVVQFLQSDLYGANLSKATLSSETRFSGCDLRTADLRGMTIELRGADGGTVAVSAEEALSRDPRDPLYGAAAARVLELFSGSVYNRKSTQLDQAVKVLLDAHSSPCSGARSIYEASSSSQTSVDRVVRVAVDAPEQEIRISSEPVETRRMPIDELDEETARPPARRSSLAGIA